MLFGKSHFLSVFLPSTQVRLSTKQNLAFYTSKPLSLSKCLELAHHYLGFSGWSTRIITVSNHYHLVKTLHFEFLLIKAKCLFILGLFVDQYLLNVYCLQLKDLSSCVDAGCPEERDSQGVLLKYGCLVELTLKQHGVSCRGVGVAEEIIDSDRGEFTNSFCFCQAVCLISKVNEQLFKGCTNH